MVLRFADGIYIVTESPWRFLTLDGIAVTSEDHGHQFGLPAPVDAAERVLASVSNSLVVAACITRPAADLILNFGGGAYLQFFQMSSGYEAWRRFVYGEQIICTGGGIVSFDSPEPNPKPFERTRNKNCAEPKAWRPGERARTKPLI